MTKKLNNALKIFLLIFVLLFIGCSNNNDNNNGNNKKDNEENNQENEENEGNEEENNITTKLPELPEAVGGMLTKEKYEKMPNREVTEETLQEFFAEFLAAKGFEEDVSAQRGVDGKKRTFSRLRREKATRTTPDGFESGSFTIPDRQGGKIIWEWTYKREETETAEYYEITETGTEIYKSFDYSQSGKLFLGEAISSSFHECLYGDETGLKEIMEGKATGKIEFMGEFAGSIEYKLPYYKETYGSVASAAYRSGDLYEGEIIINSGKNKIKLPIDYWWEFWYLV